MIVSEKNSLTLTKQDDEIFGFTPNAVANGTIIGEFSENTPAHQSRLMVGDKILTINGKELSDNDGITSLIERSGDKINMDLKGTEQTKPRPQFKNPIKFWLGII